MKKNEIPRLWNVPLFDYHLKWNASDKDLESLEKEETSIVGYIHFLCVISLFIYFWIVDYGKDGVMDIVIEGKSTTNADKIVQGIQWSFHYLSHDFINFIFDFILYGFISLLIGTAFAMFLNFILKNIFKQIIE
ncbi:hypothetical protein N9B89_04340 [Flavobacteriales bacterium]|nr:hypothetical protein [Flavobacteriales bacterium]